MVCVAENSCSSVLSWESETWPLVPGRHGYNGLENVGKSRATRDNGQIIVGKSAPLLHVPAWYLAGDQKQAYVKRVLPAKVALILPFLRTAGEQPI